MVRNCLRLMSVSVAYGCVAALLLMLGLALPGCGPGTAPLWSQTNPETSIAMNPLTKTVKFYSNDGKTFSAELIAAKWGDNSIELRGLDVKDRSVENRQVNVQQMAMANEITATAIRETFAGFVGMIREGLMPLKGASAEVDTPVGGGKVKLGGGDAPKEADP